MKSIHERVAKIFAMDTFGFRTTSDVLRRIEESSRTILTPTTTEFLESLSGEDLETALIGEYLEMADVMERMISNEHRQRAYDELDALFTSIGPIDD